MHAEVVLYVTAADLCLAVGYIREIRRCELAIDAQGCFKKMKETNLPFQIKYDFHMLHLANISKLSLQK